MAILCYSLIIAILISIWAAPQSEANAAVAAPGSVFMYRTTKVQHVKKTTWHRERKHLSTGKVEKRETGQSTDIIVDSKLFRKRRFQSPRVLFSTQPPPMPRDGRSIELSDGVDSHNWNIRDKRQIHIPNYYAELDVCDSISEWVTNKTTAIDVKGNEVSVLAEFNLNKKPVKQYFFETRCKNPKSVSDGCRGIDSSHWNSYCTNTQSFVRGLTMANENTAWRYIKINTGCVCLVSRKNQNS